MGNERKTMIIFMIFVLSMGSDITIDVNSLLGQPILSLRGSHTVRQIKAQIAANTPQSFPYRLAQGSRKLDDSTSIEKSCVLTLILQEEYRTPPSRPTSPPM